MRRASGILMPLFSLPNEQGIGSLGKCARDFADYAAACGCSYWQMLPLNPTGYGDSPYQSVSTFAGNPYFIDLDELVAMGLLRREEIPRYRRGRVDYGRQFATREPLLRLAYRRAVALRGETARFARENRDWLEDYALFLCLRREYGCGWRQWPADLREHRAPALEAARERYAEGMAYYRFEQFLFFRQAEALRAHCARLGLRLIGDLPIYVAMDGADVWAHRELFQFRRCAPTGVAGVPPDYFSPTGQLWGNPLYRWDALKRTGYAWWTARVRQSAKLFDVLRLDHFRGFASYWRVPAGALDARQGSWEPGGGAPFLAALPKNVDYIAEDLGLITDDVRVLRDRFGLPGMNVLQFAFGPGRDSAYLPHRHVQNSVTYVGTHDNDTARGYLAAASEEERRFVRDYVGGGSLAEGLLRAAFASVSDLAVATLPDVIGLRAGRINTPARPDGNWTFRLPGDRYRDRTDFLRELNRTFGR